MVAAHWYVTPVSSSEISHNRRAASGSRACFVAPTRCGKPCVSNGPMGPKYSPLSTSGMVAAYSCGSAPITSLCATTLLSTPIMTSISLLPLCSGPAAWRWVLA